MIRLLAFISIVSLLTKVGTDSGAGHKNEQDSLKLAYNQFLSHANLVSGEPVDFTQLNMDFFVMMDYGHCSKCAKEVLEFMADAGKSGFKVAMVHYGGQESYGSNRATRNKYKFEYPYLEEVYFSPINIPDKSKVPIVAVPKSGKFIEYEDFNEESELLLVKIKNLSGEVED